MSNEFISTNCIDCNQNMSSATGVGFREDVYLLCKKCHDVKESMIDNHAGDIKHWGDEIHKLVLKNAVLKLQLEDQVRIRKLRRLEADNKELRKLAQSQNTSLEVLLNKFQENESYLAVRVMDGVFWKRLYDEKVARLREAEYHLMEISGPHGDDEPEEEDYP